MITGVYRKFKAFDSKGIALIVTKTDDNTWNIKNAKSLAKFLFGKRHF
jgi:hypothetical protein